MIFYRKGRIAPYDKALDAEVKKLARDAAGKADCVLAVVAGSASAWQYDKSLPAEQCFMYDANAEQLRACFEAHGVIAITGATEFSRLELGDAIGHVSVSSETDVFDSYVTWQNLCEKPRTLQAGDCEFAVSESWQVDFSDAQQIAEQSSLEVASVEGLALAVTVPSRKWGYVELCRGEFAMYESQLIAQALSTTPIEFLDSLREDGLWKGLPWPQVAKMIFVQERWLVNDGWNVLFHVFR